jgi:hypothetical protein
VKRTIPGTPGTVQQPEATEYQAGASAMPAPPLRTEYPFELPRGYLDSRGILHKRGVMRMATARDELLPLSDARVIARPAYLTVIILGRVITQLGDFTDEQIDHNIIELLFAADLAFLQDLYRRINQEGHTRAAVTCPNCEHEFTVDVAGGSSGGS